jgi:16S rRNA processing protein RimM
LVRTRGNRGELAAIPLSSNPERSRHVTVNGTPLEVEEFWTHRDQAIFKFRGIDSISAAEPLVGADVCIPSEERAALPEGEYYQSDLIGCEVVERKTGETIGVVEAWQEYGGPPLIEVKGTDGREILIPFAKSICVRIDPTARRIEVDMPEGLNDL